MIDVTSADQRAGFREPRKRLRYELGIPARVRTPSGDSRPTLSACLPAMACFKVPVAAFWCPGFCDRLTEAPNLALARATVRTLSAPGVAALTRTDQPRSLPYPNRMTHIKVHPIPVTLR
jgi:hypothetical protein